MRGHIRKRGKNSWAVVVDLGRDPASGKRRQKWFAHKTRREAEAHLAQIVAAMQERRVDAAGEDAAWGLLRPVAP